MLFFQSDKNQISNYSSLQTKKTISYDELFDLIKDVPLAAGDPFISGTGMMRCIQFHPTSHYKILISINGTNITVSKVLANSSATSQEKLTNSIQNVWYNSIKKESSKQNEIVHLVLETIRNVLQTHHLAK